MGWMDGWFRRAGLGRSGDHAVVAPPVLLTRRTTTVFSGTSEAWLSYLRRPRSERYDRGFLIEVEWDPDRRLLRLHPRTPRARELREAIRDDHQTLQRLAERKPHVAEVLRHMAFGNPTNGLTPLHIHVSRQLPSEATREVAVDSDLEPVETELVLQAKLVEHTIRAVRRAGDDPEEHFAATWPLLRRILSQLDYSSHPRDRFVEKIDVVARGVVLSVNLLYDHVSFGKLVPNVIGQRYHEYLAERDGYHPDEVADRHPYLRLLNECDFLLREEGYRQYGDELSVLVREYLDERYLRLSVAGVMPPVPDELAPMPVQRRGPTLRVPRPHRGRYGIVTHDDLHSWKRLAGPFRDMGFALVRQLGIGEFGRVYEAVNADRPNMPDRLAIKVDRVDRRGGNEIQRAEVALDLSRALSRAPHVIRIFDAGRLAESGHTYHILQLIDGDTLDHLVGVAGREHASVHRPSGARTSQDEVREEVHLAVSSSCGEAWRRHRPARKFLKSPLLPVSMDLLTSIVLWLEEVHALGYAVNDLKNGNLMVSRRGQLKGIDLDTYSPIRSATDRMPDFYFLSVSLLLYYLGLSEAQAGDVGKALDNPLLRDRDVLRSRLEAHWDDRVDVVALSDGRVRRGEVLDMLLDLVLRCRDNTYAKEPEAFSADIDRLIHLKRRLSLEEIVLD
jgi:hypothetical protein